MLTLHGYSETGAQEEAYFKLGPELAEREILYAHPDGLVDAVGFQFWNASPGCCDLFGTEVDDSSYLRDVIDEIRATASVDSSRIFLVGHSNGGFMSHRMACDHADVIAGIVSLAGAANADPSACGASEPVAVLQIHGTADEVIPYDGDGDTVPSAAETVAQWSAIGGCGAAIAGEARDIDAAQPGAETTVEAFADCAVELWTIPAAGHIPALAPSFATQVVDFLLANPKQ